MADDSIASDSRLAPTLAGLRLGALVVWPIVPTVLLYGLAFGVLGAAAGLSALETTLISGLVNAGAAQMASLQAWSDPVPLLAVCLTTAAMNARYLLLGAALRPWFGRLPGWQSYGTLFLMGDGNWALTMRELRGGRGDLGVLLGSGIVLWLGWVGATLAGHLFGALLGDPAGLGIDFLLPAFFATLAVAFFRRRGSALPLAVGVMTAVLVERLVAGPWYILAGALAGSLAGGLRGVPQS